MQFTTPDMREITISDKSEACDFIKDSCKECNRKYECTGENAAFCNHMKNILVAKYGAAEGCFKYLRTELQTGRRRRCNAAMGTGCRLRISSRIKVLV